MHCCQYDTNYENLDQQKTTILKDKLIEADQHVVAAGTGQDLTPLQQAIGWK